MFLLCFLNITDDQEVHDSLRKDRSEKRKHQEESLKQLGKYVMNNCIPCIFILIEVSKEERFKKRKLQEESSKDLGKYIMNKCIHLYNYRSI